MISRPVLFEGRLFIGRRFGLMLGFPLLERHAVDDFAGIILRQFKPLGLRRVRHPGRQAIPAEPGQIHHIDVLNVRSRPQMLDQTPEYRGFEFNCRLRIESLHGQLLDRQGPATGLTT